MRLQKWYSDQCNSDWEHTNGIKLETLDNPGWWIFIDLTGTELADKRFEPISIGDSESDTHWLRCQVAAGKFDAAGGAHNLQEMLEAFLVGAGY